jgi:hypothetical protein
MPVPKIDDDITMNKLLIPFDQTPGRFGMPEKYDT